MSGAALRKLRSTLATSSQNKPKFAEQRKAALDALGAETDQAVVPDVLTALNDPWIMVRDAAARALGLLADPAAVEPLIQLLASESDPDVRRAAGQSLARLQDPRAVGPLILAAAGQQRDRGWAQDAVAEFGERARGAIVEHLRHASPAVRGAALQMAARFKDPQYAGDMLPLLEDADTTLRQQAALAVGALGDNRAATALLRLLDDEDEDVQIGAAEALANLHDPTIVPRLISALESDSFEIVSHAARALGRQGDLSAVGPLVQLLSRLEVEVREAAVKALTHLECQDSFLALCAALQDWSVDVRKAAAEGLSKLDSPRVVEPLIAALDDADPGVRLIACGALASNPRPELLERFQRMLKRDRSTEVKLLLARILGQRGDPSSIPALRQALEEEFAVRCRACIALGQIGSEECIDVLMSLLDDSAAEVRFQAASALGAIGDPRAVQPLEQLIEDPELLVRRGVAKALQQLGDPRGEKLLEEVQKEAADPRKLAAAQKQERAKPRGLPIWKALPLAIHEATLPIARRLNELYKFDELSDREARKVKFGGAALASILVSLAIWQLWDKLPGMGRSASTTASAITALAPAGSSKFGVLLAQTKFTKNGRESSKEVGLFDSATGELAGVFEVPAECGPLLTIDNKQELLAVSGSDHSISLFGLADGGLVRKLEGHDAEIVGVQFVTDQKLLLSVDKKGTLKVWDVVSGEPRESQLACEQRFLAAGLSPDGAKAAFGLADGMVLIWNVAENAQMASFQGHDSDVTNLVFSNDGRLLATASSNLQLAVWNLETRKKKLSAEVKTADRMCFSPDATQLIVGLEVWNIANNASQKLAFSEEEHSGVLFAGNGKSVAAITGHDSEVFLFDPVTGAQKSRLSLRP